MWNLIKSFLPGGLALYTVAGVAVLALGGGIWLGSLIQSGKTAQVQSAFDQYRIAVVQDAADANGRTVAELRRLARNQEQMLATLRAARSVDEAFSRNLIEGLRNANGKSCELSPAVRDYVDRVRERATGTGND